jgi:DNA polymerase-1
MKKEVYLLIDSHALIHRAYHALPYLQTKDGRPSGALYGLITILLGAIERFKPDYIYAANDLPKTTFREMAFTGYKAHRTKTEDFLVEQIIAMPELFKSFDIPLLSLEGYEADDVIGTLVCKIQKEKKNYQIVILTGDMDIMQLIDDDKVVVYTAKKGEEDIIYHEQEVMKKYGLLPKQIPDYKGLRGDTSDNIPGIKGIGEKTALTILQKGGTLKNVYEEIKSGKGKEYFGITERMFELLKNGEEDAEFSRELATINCDIEVDIPSDGKFILQEKINNLKNYCEDFGFASIKKRLEKLEGLSKNRDDKGEVILNDFAVVEEAIEQKQNTNHTFNINDFKKIQILFWLLNSQETNIDEARVNYLLQKMSLSQKENIIESLEQEVAKKDLDFVYKEIELPLIPILEEANVAGIKVDREKLKTLLQSYEKTRAGLEEKIYSLAGKTFNLNSPKQLGVILFEELKVQDVGATKIKKTAGGKLSTRFEVLEEMKDNHPIIPLLLDFREKEKMINTYLEPLLVYSQFDEKIHTSFIQTGAQTGRFSSLNPNMQNIPVKGEEGVELRKCFIADEGKVLVAADYSQIELRIAAMLSEEEYLKEIFEKDEDIHTSVAKKMFKKDEVTKEERNAAKAMNFGILYGMGVNSIKNTLKVERNVAQAFYDSYTLVMPSLMRYLKDTIAKAKDMGYTETLYGRQRNIPELFANIPMIRASGERFAMNAPIQGTNADIIKLAITDFKKVCVKNKWDNKVTFLLQIHDELIYEVDEDMKDEVGEVLKEVMESVLKTHKPKNNFLPVPIKVNVKSGYNWGEM